MNYLNYFLALFYFENHEIRLCFVEIVKGNTRTIIITKKKKTKESNQEEQSQEEQMRAATIQKTKSNKMNKKHNT